jgi:tRNA threonylcarbamoyl adenosine modification protein YeaZ
VLNRTEIISLAVETAVGSGSLALFNGDCLVDQVCGTASTSRAEDLLPAIERLLHPNGIRKSSISRIAISTGPGSYTGLRIGIASVLGLSKALGIDVEGIPLFSAVDCSVSDRNVYVTAVPMGKNDICFEVKGSAADARGIRVKTLDSFISTIDSYKFQRVLAHSDIVEQINERFGRQVEITDLGANMAEYVGRAAMLNVGRASLAPIYVHNPRFG